MHKNFLVFITNCLLLLLGHCQVVKADDFLISYVEHTGIINYYVPLLDKAYQKIGIQPTFVLINDQRALRLLDSNKIDADTAKSLESIPNYPNITYIPTPISKIEVFFICQSNIQCDRSVLYDHSKSLAVIGANEFYQDLLTSASIQLLELTSFEILYKVFEQNKVDVAIIVLDAYTKHKLALYPNHFKITEKLGYHLLHKKHQALLQKLEIAIAEVLAEGNFAKN